MKSLRFRIALTWACFAAIGVSFLVGFWHPLVIAIFCLLVPAARHCGTPAFPRAPRWFERLVLVLLLPAIFFFALGFAFGFVQPWAQVGRIALWICLPLLLVFVAFEDMKTWRAERNA